MLVEVYHQSCVKKMIPQKLELKCFGFGIDVVVVVVEVWRSLRGRSNLTLLRADAALKSGRRATTRSDATKKSGN